MSMAIIGRTEDEARRHLTRIRLTAGIVRDNLPKLQALITEAKEQGDDRVLGYASWTAYVADAFSDEPMRLPREERQELVAMLAGEGMSTRAISPIVGVTHETVAQDMKAPVRNLTPAREPDQFDRDVAEAEAAIRPETVNPVTGELIEDAVVTETHTVKIITGLDGKSYPKPEPKKPQRRPLTDAASDIGWELRKTVEKLERLTADDRFPRNKEEVAAHLRSHLQFTVESCQGILDVLNQSRKD